MNSISLTTIEPSSPSVEYTLGIPWCVTLTAHKPLRLEANSLDIEGDGVPPIVLQDHTQIFRFITHGLHLFPLYHIQLLKVLEVEPWGIEGEILATLGTELRRRALVVRLSRN